MCLKIPPPQRVLIVLLSGLGDTLMFTPALNLLRMAWPQTRLVALTMRTSEYDVLKHNSNLNEVKLWPFLKESFFSNLRFMAEIRREGFDLAILPCPSNRVHYNGLGFFSGAKQRVGFRYLQQSRRNLDFLNTILFEHREDIHNVEHNIAMAEELTGTSRGEIPVWKERLTLPTVASDREQAIQFLKAEGIQTGVCVGIHVSSSRAKHMERKCWPKEHFLQLIRSLRRKYDGLKFILFCGEEDRMESEWLRKEAGPFLRMAAGLPSRTIAEIIRYCRVLVTNDSGLLHVASAVETPSVAIFGPTNPRRTGAWKARSEVVRTGLPCSPCFYHTSHELTCPVGLNFSCLRDLPVELVLKAVERSMEFNP